MSYSPFALRTVSDHVLLEALSKLASDDAALEADLLVHLREVEARGLALAKGFTSLFEYCVQKLHFSESVAYHRIAAARAARRFPEILERIRTGQLHLSGLRLLLPHLTAHNCVELLDLARHQSKRAIEERLADRRPKPDAPAQVRKLPEREPETKPLVPAPPPATPTTAPAESTHSAAMPEVPRPSTEPLGESRYKVQFTAGPGMYAKLRQAQALLRHEILDGDLGRLFDRALDALLREARRTKFAETDRPRAEQRGSTSRRIPAAIRRQVAARDGERCTFVAPDGRRCDSHDALEFHHRIPFARTRRHRAEEITLRCRAHNGYAAIQDFGDDHMQRFRRDHSSTVWPRGK